MNRGNPPTPAGHRRPGRVAGPGTIGLLGLLGALWALHIVLAKAIGAENPREALAMLIVYVSASATFLVGLVLVRGRGFRPTGAMVRYFVVSSGFGYLGPIFVELLVAPRIDAGVFALVAGATPLATVGISVAAGRDRLTQPLAAALVAGSAAALVLLGPAAWHGAGAPAGWIALAFLVPLLYGAGDVFIEARWPRTLDLSQIAAGEAIAAILWSVFLAAAFGVRPADVARIAAEGRWALAGLVATALVSTLIYFSLLGRAGAVFVSFASYVTIAAGVVAGIVLFGERPGASLAVAAVLTALALLLLNRDRARAAAGTR